MGYVRSKTIEFAKLNPKARKGDKAEIHGISYNQFMEVQELISQAKEAKTEAEKLKLSSRANVTFITSSCHSITLDGVTIEPTEEDITGLDTIYYQILLNEVLDFNAYGENEKN